MVFLRFEFLDAMLASQARTDYFTECYVILFKLVDRRINSIAYIFQNRKLKLMVAGQNGNPGLIVLLVVA